MLHSAHRFVLLALQTALIAGLAILMAALIKIFARFTHDEPPMGCLSEIYGSGQVPITRKTKDNHFGRHGNVSGTVEKKAYLWNRWSACAQRR